MKLQNCIIDLSRHPITAITLILAAAIASLPAAAQSASATDHHPVTGAHTKMDSEMDMRKSMDAMHAKMDELKMSGDVDRDFVMMMRMHHQGAIDMSQMEIDSGKDPAAIKAAKKIIVAQKKEIAQFDAWLTMHPMK